MPRETIEEGIRSGEFRGIHSQLVAESILASIQHVMSPVFLSEVGLSMTEAIGEVEDLILHGLLHPDRRGRKRRETL